MYVFTRPVAFNWWVVSAGHVSRWSAIDHHTWTFLIHPNEIIVSKCIDIIHCLHSPTSRQCINKAYNSVCIISSPNTIV
ncbi:hypothetical protein DERP_007671 [Dermatophagoides pteronyssinus]|uniref:Uncharacterized protein n=1 Tax=Dermatophagoides pteronyssinus TaxID=6956 RepID=A0ABQ8JKU8_DERPT|nr:hypothetical protein DERP_007671 [Dermatophagoides pteronyssinus]